MSRHLQARFWKLVSRLTSIPLLMSYRFRRSLFTLLTVAQAAAGQEAPKAQPVIGTGEVVQETKKKDLAASLSTQKEARTMRLSIPAPRGQIVDRNGIALAQNRVVYYLALNFPFMDKADSQTILAFAKEKIGAANKLLGKTWMLPDDKLISHYQNRRWLPLVFSLEEGLNVELSQEQQDKLKPLLEQGSLLLQPAYIRHYPKEETACHILGYSGKTRRLPEGPIVDGDPLFEEIEGRDGLEITFDAALKGIPGEINLLFDADGKLLSDEVLRRPSPGRTVVTTLDYHLQKYAENALKKNARNGGAMVIMDVRNGEILAMASNPSFNPNEFVFGIRSKRWEELSTDPRMPLLARSFRGEYPPASTFKIVTALGALESGKVTLEPEELDVAELAAKLCRELEPRLREPSRLSRCWPRAEQRAHRPTGRGPSSGHESPRASPCAAARDRCALSRARVQPRRFRHRRARSLRRATSRHRQHRRSR